MGPTISSELKNKSLFAIVLVVFAIVLYIAYTFRGVSRPVSSFKFGLVAIVDHGEGYMSVYGHNQALLKQAGDDVSQGERIALVGRSGGQEYPNLYFEIRHKGKALNPKAWLD